MKTLLYANRAEPKSISVISILLLAAVGAITKLRCMHRECYIFASQNLWSYYLHPVPYLIVYTYITIDYDIFNLCISKYEVIFTKCTYRKNIISANGIYQ